MHKVRAYLSTLSTEFDSRVIAYFVSVYLGLKGGAGGLLRLTWFPLLKGVGVNSQNFQRYSVLISLPWAAKPFFGMLDFVPFRGYGKRWYITMAAVAGTSAAVALAVNAQTASAPSITALATIVSAQIALTDIISEGRYVALMKESPDTGATIMTFVWLLMFSANIMVALVAGPVADDGNAHLLLWIVAALCAQMLVAARGDWLMDTSTAVPISQENKWVIWMAGGVIVASGTTAAFVSVGAWQAQLAGSIAIVVGTVALVHTFMPSPIAQAATFLFLSATLSLRFPGALDYFYTASPECVPGGPAFSLTFYLTTATLVSALCGIIGVCIFQGTFSSWHYKTLMRLTIVLRSVVALVDVAIISRATLQAGIPDHVAYLFADSCFGTILATLDTMAMAMLTSFLCPPGTETIVYAIVAGLQNLGGSVAEVAGNAIGTAFGIKFDGTECEYSNFVSVLLAGTVVLPLVLLPLTATCLPDVAISRYVPDRAER